MTMPHLMNCDHADYGRCLDCVKGLHDEADRLRELRDLVLEFAKNDRNGMDILASADADRILEWALDEVRCK